MIKIIGSTSCVQLSIPDCVQWLPNTDCVQLSIPDCVQWFRWHGLCSTNTGLCSTVFNTPWVQWCINMDCVQLCKIMRISALVHNKKKSGSNSCPQMGQAKSYKKQNICYLVEICRILKLN